MNLLHILLVRLGLRREAGTRTFELDAPLHAVVSNLAEVEQRLPEEITSDLLANGLVQRDLQARWWVMWESLSPREKDVTALTCLGYTNKQIASKLHVSPDTIKGYVRQVLVKFHMHSKEELRMRLVNWDFKDWGPRAQI